MLDPFSKEKKDNLNTNIFINRLIRYNSAKMRNQNKIIINNIEIFFPFSPHEIQIIYIKKILHNLNQKFLLKDKYKGIAAIESPIGTGKILCLLCSTLAWINDMRKTNSYKGKIIYTTKSYDNISHIINELNKTYYQPKICILFSPYEACINNNINNSKDDKIIYMKCKTHYLNCEFYKNNNNNNYIYEINNNNDYLDIEELSNFTFENKICPFFYEKNNINNSDIIFMPYDFLFNKTMKKILDIQIKDNILIIDESHNLSKLCQDVNSFSITINDLEEIIQDLYKFIKEFNFNINYKIKENDIKYIILSINRIIKNINNNQFNILQGEVYPDKGMILSKKDFLSLFLSKNVNYYNNNTFENSDLEHITLDNINKHIYLLKYLEQLFYLNFERKTKLPIYFSILEKINNFYINQNNNDIDSYIFFLSYIKADELNIQNKIRKLNIYCFDPSLSFKEIIDEKPYSIFLTSDTLAPFDILENEFKLSFDIKLENEHLIQNNQFTFSIIQSTLYNDEKITFELDYLHRSNIKMIIALGYTLISLCSINKNGSILVYFSSKVYLNQCTLIWKDNNIIDKLQEINNIYLTKKNLKKIKKLKNEKNYIFFVVFDKNTSPEEIFFQETNITMVICLGIPYDTEYSYNDRIQLKIKYLDDKLKNKYKNKIKINDVNDYSKYKINHELTGEKWYEKNAIYIINRFLGKSLQLLSGYGSLICIDNRYESALNNGFFSAYLKNNCEIINIEDNTYFESLILFFEKIKNNINHNFTFFNNNNNIYNIEQKHKNIQYTDEEEESENYFFNKKVKNKIFYIPNKEKNLIDDIFNDTKKLEELIFNPKKLNQFLNMSNINIDNKFLQKKINKEKEEIIPDDENNNNIQNKKIKTEEYQNRETLFKNYYNYEGNNTFQNFCVEYDNKNKCEKENEEVNKNINIKNNNNENVNDTNDKNNKIDNDNNNINEEMEYEPNLEILEQLNNNTYTQTTKEVYECPICFKTSSKNPDLIYSISKCKHVLCNICWSGWLTEKLECPLCKGKARPKTLKKLIFVN